MNNTEYLTPIHPGRQTIKLNFAGFASANHERNNLIIKILMKHFNIEISPEPDFIICDSEGTHFEFMRFDCVKIFISTENFSPDFTLFDYFIGFDYLDFGDRYFRLPYAFQNESGDPWIPEIVTEEKANEIYNNKQLFCNFIYRHKSLHGVREEILDALNSYKTVTSAGNYRNNLLGQEKCYNKGAFLRINRSEKLQILEQSKFTVASESVAYPGFETEKIVHAFQTHSIPIYYSSNTITKTFNPKAFINVNELSMEEMVDEVRRIDEDKNAYIEMLMQCPLNDRMFVSNLYTELEQWLVQIFSQDPKEAFRRPKGYYVDTVNNSLKDLLIWLDKQNKPVNKKIRRIKRTIRNLVK